MGVSGKAGLRSVQPSASLTSASRSSVPASTSRMTPIAVTSLEMDATRTGSSTVTVRPASLSARPSACVAVMPSRSKATRTVATGSEACASGAAANNRAVSAILSMRRMVAVPVPAWRATGAFWHCAPLAGAFRVSVESHARSTGVDRSRQSPRARWCTAVLRVAGLACSPAALAQARVDLTTLDEGMHGAPAQVLVLGTLHLDEVEGFDPSVLDPLLDRLASFNPSIITIESLTGEECDLYARHPTVYEGGLEWCPETVGAREATGPGVPAAISAVHATRADWPEDPAPAQRRRLAALFLAAGDPASAYVQWLQLAPQERRAGDGLDGILVAKLEELGKRNGEDIQIAARLAARLGHERVYPVDNHTGDDLRIDDVEAFAEEISAAWGVTAAEHAPVHERRQALGRGGDVLALYRYLNSAESLQVA